MITHWVTWPVDVGLNHLREVTYSSSLMAFIVSNCLLAALLVRFLMIHMIVLVLDKDSIHIFVTQDFFEIILVSPERFELLTHLCATSHCVVIRVVSVFVWVVALDCLGIADLFAKLHWLNVFALCVINLN